LIRSQGRGCLVARQPGEGAQFDELGLEWILFCQALDGMVIPRVKAKRREVRRMLAQRSKELPERYRCGEPVGDRCLLKRALAVQKSAVGKP
jgi:hypothetical protein